MESMQLQGSVICSDARTTYTLFIACLEGRYGVVRAGDWETVLPFRFEHIEALEDGNLAACRGGRWTIYRPVAAPGGCRLAALRPRRRTSPSRLEHSA